MTFGDWEDVEAALLRALGLLAEGDFLILGEPTADPLPRRGLFGRRAKPVATRYVQVLRIEDLFTAECVGAASLGGTWEMSKASIDRLLSLGWRSPEESTARVRQRHPQLRHVRRAHRRTHPRRAARREPAPPRCPPGGPHAADLAVTVRPVRKVGPL